MKKILLLLICALLMLNLQAQRTREPSFSDSNNKGNAILFHFNLGSHIPAADMAKRFGNDLSIGGGLERITENNLIVGVEGHFFFSQKVKEDPLAALRTPEGDIIGIDQAIASLVLRERGFYIGANMGKLITFNEKRRRGLRLTGSLGWLQHKIRLQDDGQTVPQVTGNYAFGYDRLTGGLALNEFVGWQQLSISRRINWYVGFEFGQGFTGTLRDYDFAEQRKLSERRLDLRFGVRAGWVLPFYQRKAEDIYY
jgi:hypothetical protein